ncbi:TPA: methionyl-tRNA formyltransferase [Candidatus Scatousia excrementigallinarum]|uniref:Methionyl-tRNA formyltransferase n=1 Tax=Candidatus Scatousia excrementigallinarum TaxID=2840935 RepID=A0A9D1EZ20_9BACT|nr:methionyl-tRNA formyltransferase [Candidatus Scatousia excrementigallinarum]
MIRVIFFGTPAIALNSLEYLYNSDKIEVAGVVTQPDKPAGRGHKLTMSVIKQFALKHDIPVFQPKSIRKDPEIQKALKALNPDFFVTFAFGQILSQEVLDIPKYETINLHASLLPKYRGANPIQRAIINGDKETGICTMITELGLDCGDVCLKQVIPIPETMNCEELFEKISVLSPELLEKTLRGLVEGSIKPIPQCEDGVCMANKLTKEETAIDWLKSAREIHNLVRGIYKFPSAHFMYNGKLIKVLQTKVVDGNGKPGEFVEITKEGVKVACGKDCLLLERIKPEGKGEMNARDWYNGLKKQV